MVFTGDVTSTQALEELGIVIGLWGCVLFIGGYSLFTSLMWPLFYLLFISSLTEGAFDMFTNFFRNASAQVSFILARMTGYSIMHNGTYLRLPAMILNVANECSGINHFISLAAISLPLAVLTQRKSWPIIVIVLSSFPIALFSNSLRVFFLIAYNYNRIEFSHGPKNILVTGVGFFFGLLMLYGLSMLLARFTQATSKAENKSLWGEIKQFVTSINLKSLYLLTAIMICGFIMLSLWKVTPAEQPQLFTQPFTALPIQCGSTNVFPGINELPESDRHIILHCNNNTPDHYYLLLSWYAKQEPGREMNGYNWNKYFTRTGSYSYVSGTGTIIDFNLCSAHSANEQFRYLITWRCGNRYVADPIKVRLHLLLNALLHRSTSGTIFIIAILPYNGNNNSIESLIKSILDPVFPIIHAGLK